MNEQAAQPIISDKNIFYALAALVLLLNLITVLPTLDTGFLCDDEVYESSARGASLLAGKSCFQLAWDDIVGWVTLGRWHPLLSYRILVFCYLDRFAYKALTVAFVLSNVIIFGYLVFLITSCRWSSLLSMLLPPAFFQFRWGYHDAFIAYYFLLEIIALLLFLSLIMLLFYLRNGKRYQFGLSVLFYALCSLLYEITYAFFVLHFLVAYSQLGKSKLREALRVSLPFFLVAVTNAAITVLIRVVFGSAYQGVKLNYDPIASITTFLKQIYAAIPLTHYINNLWLFPNAFDYAVTCWLEGIFVVSALWALLCYLIGRLWLSYGCHASDQSTRTMVLLGLGLWILPAPLIAITGKYQEELRLGIGYLPVYISVFGVMMLFIALVWKLLEIFSRGSSRLRSGIGLFAVLTGGLVCGINYNYNQVGVSLHRYHYLEDREVLEKALESGLMKEVSNGSYLIGPRPYDARFYLMHSGVNLKVIWPFSSEYNIEESAMKGVMRLSEEHELFRGRQKPYRFAPQDNVFVIRSLARPGGAGYAILARVSALDAQGDRINGIAADKVYVYWQSGSLCWKQAPWLSKDSILVVGRLLDRTTLKSRGWVEYTLSHLKLRSADCNGRLYEIPSSALKGDLDVRALDVVARSPNVAMSAFRKQ
ncbi:MAG: hypothetical protein ACOYXY_22280 [Thermodesulfobacteriota bacterium]